jgi:FeS assembly SUF system regulator
MVRFAKLTDYALRLTAELAQAPRPTLSTVELGARTGLEPTTVAKVLKTLARADVVRSTRGVSGGYRLSDDGARLSVAHVVEAMEGPLGLTDCVADPGSCAHEGRCGVANPLKRVSKLIEQTLRGIRLDELTVPTRRVAMRLQPELRHG